MKPKISIITSLFKSEKYLEFYFDATEAVVNKENYEFLLLLNQPNEEELYIINNKIKGKKYYKLHIIKEKESLYATWNRGVKLAKADYLANWNVDDCRTPESLKIQAATLDKNPNAAMTYGDQTAIMNMGDKFGKLQTTPEYNSATKKEFRKSTFIGCFQMWRKSIHKTVGYYDEQFRLVSDYEFQIRVAHKFPLIKTNGLIGYYLSGGTERLSQNGILQNEERTAVELRYGIFYKMNLVYLFKAFKYKVFNISEFGDFVRFGQYIPEARYNFIINCYQILWSVLFNLPFDSLQFVKMKLLPNLVVKKIFK